MYRVLTIAREFGSGGAEIAAMIAARLGWELIDNALVMQVAKSAKVDPKLAHRLDESVDSWVHRVARRALWRGVIEAVSTVPVTDLVDAESIAALATTLIHEAYAKGNCVIVGRGSQCVLQDRKDAFHVFIYAPFAEKAARIRKRYPDANVPQLIESTERKREQYVQRQFGCNRIDPHLYHLLISSALGCKTTALTILEAMGRPVRDE